MHFQDDDEFQEEEEMEKMENEPFLEEQLRAIYASKSRPSKHPITKPKLNFPMFPKEQYDLFSEDVKDVLRQQHASNQSIAEGFSKRFQRFHQSHAPYSY